MEKTTQKELKNLLVEILESFLTFGELMGTHLSRRSKISLSELDSLPCDLMSIVYSYIVENEESLEDLLSERLQWKNGYWQFNMRLGDELMYSCTIQRESQRQEWSCLTHFSTHESKDPFVTFRRVHNSLGELVKQNSPLRRQLTLIKVNGFLFKK